MHQAEPYLMDKAERLPLDARIKHARVKTN